MAPVTTVGQPLRGHNLEDLPYREAGRVVIDCGRGDTATRRNSEISDNHFFRPIIFIRVESARGMSPECVCGPRMA